jgi:PhzF family phenazine biosynthesis protein
MIVSIYQVDAFTDTLFRGNPAAVVPLTEWLPVPLMQKIASETNLADTAFFMPIGDDYELRWFTPELEIDLCGHATLATAHILFTLLGYEREVIHFHTLKAGTLTVHRNGDKYMLDFPSRAPEASEVPSGLIEAIGGKPAEILRSRDYFLVYNTEAEVRALKPDFNSLRKIESIGFIATAPGENSDFVSRFFAPATGTNEDPVTGSAHCSLIPYWAERLRKENLHAYQISSRVGELWCQHKDDRVLISGKAVTFMKGEIYV